MTTLKAGYTGGPVLIQVDVKDQPILESYLNRSDVRALLPPDLRYTKFLWGIPDLKTDLVDLYVIKANPFQRTTFKRKRYCRCCTNI